MTDWFQYLPSGLPQYLKQETNGCSDFAPIDSIESQLFKLTGQHYQFSRRRLAQKSKTSPTQGNSEQVVFPVIAQGLVLETSWPQRDNMTSAEFYTAPTPEEEAILLAEEAEFIKKWDISYKFNVPFTAIDQAPLIAYLSLPKTFHFVEVLSANWYYDSEYHGGHIGVCPPFGQALAYHQIIIKPRGEHMLVFFQVKGNPTIWDLDQGQWVGFADINVFNSFVGGRTNVILEIDQSEFDKIKINPNVHKS